VLGISLGVSAGGLVVLALCLFLYCCVLRRRRARNQKRALRLDPSKGAFYLPGAYGSASGGAREYGLNGMRPSGPSSAHGRGSCEGGQRGTGGSSTSPYDRSAINEVEWNRFELIRWDRVTLHDFIGSGTTGDVYQAQYASTEVACKLLRKRQVSEREMQFLVDECQLMLKLRHPNVLLMIGITSDRVMNHGILTELMDFSLSELIERSVEPEPTWDYPFVSIARDVARGMAYLHEHRVLHRDLKPGNVLLKQPGMIAKVADFGASRDLAPGAAGANASMTMTMAGTPVFMAPEVLRQDRYGKEADVWSFGGLLVHIATRCPPYTKLLETTPPYALMQSIAHSEIRPTTDIDDLCPDWPDAIKAIAEQCCMAERADRPTFEQIARDLQGTFHSLAFLVEKESRSASGSCLSSRPSAPNGQWAREDAHSRSLRDSKVSVGGSPHGKRAGSDADRGLLSSVETQSSSRRSIGGRKPAPSISAGGRGSSPVRFIFGPDTSNDGNGRPGTRLEQARLRASERSRLSPVHRIPPVRGSPNLGQGMPHAACAREAGDSQAGRTTTSSSPHSARDSNVDIAIPTPRSLPPPPPTLDAMTREDSSDALNGLQSSIGVEGDARASLQSIRSSTNTRRGGSLLRPSDRGSSTAHLAPLPPSPNAHKSRSISFEHASIDLEVGDELDAPGGSNDKAPPPHALPVASRHKREEKAESSRWTIRSWMSRRPAPS
jgi:protein kinase 1